MAFAWLVPRHYPLNQCLLIVNWTIKNKLQWNLNQNINIILSRNYIWKYHLQNGGHFVQACMCHQRWLNLQAVHSDLMFSHSTGVDFSHFCVPRCDVKNGCFELAARLWLFCELVSCLLTFTAGRRGQVVLVVLRRKICRELDVPVADVSLTSSRHQWVNKLQPGGQSNKFFFYYNDKTIVICIVVLYGFLLIICFGYVMAWHWIGDEPLPRPVMWFNSNMDHQATNSLRSGT